MSYSNPNHITHDTTWTSLSLVNGWVNYGSVFGTPRYRRLNGVVYVEGLVASGSGTIATLSAGFRPIQQLIFSTTTNPNVYGRFDILETGEIVARLYDAGWFSICCSFRADIY